MPLYVYKCNNCEHQFEVRQRFSDDQLSVCPKCEGLIRRVINPVGVVFKGSGFYVTDSRNGKTSSLMNGKSQTEEKSETAEKKSDEKSAPAASTTKSESKSPVSSVGASST